MKNIAFYIIAILGLLTACDPVCDEKDMGGNITADQLKAMSSVTVKQENGKNINYVECTTSAPCTVVWSNGVENTTKPTTEFTMLVTGEQNIKLTALCADGTMLKVEFPVNIEEMSDSYPVSKLWGLLCGSGEKTWEWDNSINDHCWGNFGYSAMPKLLTEGDWWGTTSYDRGIDDDFSNQLTNYNYGFKDGGDATMTFSLDGATITKSSGGTGTFSFDDKNTTNMAGFKDVGPSMGHLMTTGDGILFPVRINVGLTTSEFEIAYIDEDHLILDYPNHFASEEGSASWNEGTFWRFKAKK